jgi:hypothetical protein
MRRLPIPYSEVAPQQRVWTAEPFPLATEDKKASSLVLRFAGRSDDSGAAETAGFIAVFYPNTVGPVQGLVRLLGSFSPDAAEVDCFEIQRFKMTSNENVSTGGSAEGMRTLLVVLDPDVGNAGSVTVDVVLCDQVTGSINYRPM